MRAHTEGRLLSAPPVRRETPGNPLSSLSFDGCFRPTTAIGVRHDIGSNVAERGHADAVHPSAPSGAQNALQAGHSTTIARMGRPIRPDYELVSLATEPVRKGDGSVRATRRETPTVSLKTTLPPQ